MPRLRNRAPAIGLGLGLLAVASYFVVVTPMVGPHVPWLRDVPALNAALLAVALGFAWRGARRGRWPARAAGVLTTGLAVLFAWYVLHFSSLLPAADAAPRVGAAAPDFALPDHRGGTVGLAAFRGRPVVLVFYRGFW